MVEATPEVALLHGCPQTEGEMSLLY